MSLFEGALKWFPPGGMNNLCEGLNLLIPLYSLSLSLYTRNIQLIE
jgi:hypothetical protein